MPPNTTPAKTRSPFSNSQMSPRCDTPELSSSSTAPSSVSSMFSKQNSWTMEPASPVVCEDDSISSIPRARLSSTVDLHDLLERLQLPDIPVVESTKEPTVFEVVGEGAHARVHRALLDGRQVAAKIAISRAAEKCIHRELQVIDFICTHTLDLGNITEYYALETIGWKLALLMELADCDLMTLIEAEKTSCMSHTGPIVGAARWSMFAKQMSSAVAALHKIGVVHGDIKPQNFLSMTDEVLKLADFESAYTPSGDLLQPTSSSIDIMGSNAYSAPELLRMGREPPSFESDVFSLGVSLLVLATAEEPYSRARNGIEAIIQAQSGNPIRYMQATSRITPDIDRIVRGCCAKDPSKRWTISQVLAEL